MMWLLALAGLGIAGYYAYTYYQNSVRFFNKYFGKHMVTFQKKFEIFIQTEFIHSNYVYINNLMLTLVAS